LKIHFPFSKKYKLKCAIIIFFANILKLDEIIMKWKLIKTDGQHNHSTAYARQDGGNQPILLAN
jgi:hypothetical protein